MPDLLLRLDGFMCKFIIKNRKSLSEIADFLTIPLLILVLLMLLQGLGK